MPAAALPALDAPVAAVYLQRHQVPGPVATDRILVAVEPARLGRRDLAPVRSGPTVPPGFTSIWSRTHRGFRLLELQSRARRAVGRAELGRDVLGEPPALLVVRRR